MKEIEAKMRVSEEEMAAVRARVVELGGEARGNWVERDVFFDDPGGKLRKAGCGLRLRRRIEKGTDVPKSGLSERYEDGAVREVYLTFKGPVEASVMKKRQECEVKIEGGEDEARMMEQMMGATGFGPVMRYEKSRERWKLDGCAVELDEVAELGRFVEIEGKNEESVLRVREKLGLGGKELEKRGYITMIAEVRRSGVNAK